MERYERFAQDTITPPKIQVIGFSSDKTVTRYGPTVRNEYIIHYVLSGKGYFNGAPVIAGQGMIITPGMHEEYHPDEKDPWSVLWVISTDDNMKYYINRHNACAKCSIFSYKNPLTLEEIAKEVKKSRRIMETSSRLLETFLRIFNSCIETGKEIESMAKIYFEFSVNYINQNAHLPISVGGLCETIGITQPYLYKIFKAETGVSPKRYIVNTKLKNAQKLLLETDYSITQIASSVGFLSVLDFSKFFTKNTGKSPSEFRKQNEFRKKL